MTLKRSLLLSFATLAIALLPQAAVADSLTLTLNDATQSVNRSAGGTLSFSGTITAAGNNSGSAFLNGDSFTYTGPGTFNDSAFFANAPLFLTAGQSYTGVLFAVTFGTNATIEAYDGLFSILGGSDDSATDTLATADFHANVFGTTLATTPEPSSLLLLGTGVLGTLGALRRRRIHDAESA